MSSVIRKMLLTESACTNPSCSGRTRVAGGPNTKLPRNTGEGQRTGSTQHRNFHFSTYSVVQATGVCVFEPGAKKPWCLASGVRCPIRLLSQRGEDSGASPPRLFGSNLNAPHKVPRRKCAHRHIPLARDDAAALSVNPDRRAAVVPHRAHDVLDLVQPSLRREERKVCIITTRKRAKKTKHVPVMYCCSTSVCQRHQLDIGKIDKPGFIRVRWVLRGCEPLWDPSRIYCLYYRCTWSIRAGYTRTKQASSELTEMRYRLVHYLYMYSLLGAWPVARTQQQQSLI